MFGRNNGDADRLAKKINSSVKAANRHRATRAADPAKNAAGLSGNLSRAVTRAAKRGRDENGG